MLGQRAGVLRLALELVFGLLPPRDMENVVLVCRLWREVGEAPQFWAWVVLGVTRENMSTMPERLGSRRLQAVRKLKVEEWVVVSEEVLQAMVRHQGLRVVVGGGPTLDIGLLARMVTRFGEMGMNGTSVWFERLKFDKLQVATIERQRKLRKLGTPSKNLSTVDAGLLARAVNRLVGVQFSRTGMTLEQWEGILTGISEGNSKLKRLEISCDNLSGVDAGLLARALNRLEVVEIRWSDLTQEQGEAIMTQSLVQTKLKSLWMMKDWESWRRIADLETRARLVIPEIYALRGQFKFALETRTVIYFQLYFKILLSLTYAV